MMLLGSGPDLVMECVAGPTMLQAMVSGDLTLKPGRGFWPLHDRLHQTPFVHLDLHPDNVILAESGPVVIDWTNAGEGEGDFDLAMTAVILAQVAVDEAHPMAGQRAIFWPRSSSRSSAYPLRLLSEAVAHRAADDAMTPAETALLPKASAPVRELRGQSVWIAAAKLTGTALASIAIGVYGDGRDTSLLVYLYVATFVLDVVYLTAVVVVKRRLSRGDAETDGER